MQHECFRGRNMRQAMGNVRAALGEDAMILASRTRTENGQTWAEISAAPSSAVEAFRRSLDPSHGVINARDTLQIGPRFVAVVGPPGAGKTLTAVKLALSKHAFGPYRTGFITLDTYRVGAVDQLQAYAEIAGLPLEVVYTRREVEGAIQRLRNCQVVIVDTPGRTPDRLGRFGPWEDVLEQIAPHEIHLVLPAGIRVDVVRHLRDSLEELGPTHVLPSKLDHVPGDVGLADLVETVGLPARWIADGHEVPGNLHPAAQRILTALGSTFEAPAATVGHRAAS